jgi:hypothetical protein
MDLALKILGIAALGGLTMVLIRLRGAPRPPTWLALAHGALAATGVVLLALAAFDPGAPELAPIALAVFVLAALGGTAMFVLFHLKGKALPIPFMLGHGLAALTGLAILYYSLHGNPLG